MIQPLPCKTRAGGDGENTVDLAFRPSSDLLLMEQFWDLENLQRSRPLRRVRQSDWQDLAWYIAGKVAEALGRRLVGPDGRANREGIGGQKAIRRGTVWAFASRPVNCHPRDRGLVQEIIASLEALRRLSGFKLQDWPRDLHGKPISRRSDPDSRREKYVDGAINTQITRRCRPAAAPAIIVVAAVDADMAPAMKAVLEDHPETHVFAAAFSDTLANVYLSGHSIEVKWRHGPILLDKWLVERGDLAQTKLVSLPSHLSPRKGFSTMTSQTERTGVGNGRGATVGRSTAGSGGDSDLELGQMMVTCPMFGQLAVYRKKDGRIGAKVICEQDGGKYGVTAGVLSRFQETGTYDGWAYVDPPRRLVFKFVVGRADAEPESILAIEVAGTRVGVPRSISRGMDFQHGKWVAFYSRFAGTTGEGRPRREATHVFLLDAKHLSLIVRLIAQKGLVFPEHAEVFQSFFDALPDLGDEARQHSGPLDAALARLANDPAVPAEFQMLARVERTRRSRSGGDQAGGVVPINAGGPRSKPGAGSVSRQVNDAATKAAAPSDVARVKLQLD